MKTVYISDITLREIANKRAAALSFKERVEIARTLDRLCVDTVELPVIKDEKADVLSNKTIAAVVKSATLSATTGLSEESVEMTWESVKSAKKPKLNIIVPVSAVQMEYICHMKAPAVLELVKKLVAKARTFTTHVGFTAMDATRAERGFLYEVIAAALESGASAVALCDSAGVMTPFETAEFIKDIRKNVPAVEKCYLGVELADTMKMATACAAAAVEAGACVVKTSITSMNVPRTEDFAAFMKNRGESMGLTCALHTTELERAAAQLKWMLKSEKSGSAHFESSAGENKTGITLTAKDDIGEMIKVVRHLGYELSEEDNAKVYEAFQRIAAKKPFVSTKELDAIVASAAMQVPSAYHIDSYVITCGNAISAMANLTLEKDGRKLQGVCMGDGPIDAAFRTIEQIIGHHYELDDFQIQSVTEGREAMGSALVKLRSGGKLYSGNGISTDVIGASIRAYISALNKIVYEEN